MMTKIDMRRTALLAGTAASLLTMPGAVLAQDAEAIAERFTSLLAETTEGATVSYGAASSTDGSVTLTDLTFVSPDEEDGTTTITVASTVIASPELGADNLRAASVTMTDVSALYDDGSSASATSMTLSDIDLVPQDAEYESRVASFRLTDLAATGKDRTSVEVSSVSFDVAAYFEDVPTDVTFSIEGVLIERGDMEGGMDAMFDSVGLDSMFVGVTGDGNWDRDENQLSVDDFTIDIRDLGRMSLTLALGNVTEQTFAQLESNPMIALSPLSLVSLSLDLEDGPLAETALAKKAEELGVSVEDLRTTGVVSAKQMLQFLGDSTFRRDAEAAIESYVQNEKNGLTLTANPAQPVPVMAVGLTAQTAPDSIPGLLNMSISAQ